MSAAEIAPDWRRWQQTSLIAAVVGATLFVLVALTPLAGPYRLTQAAVSYSVAFHVWLAIPLGCMVLLMIQYLTGGTWGVLLRPVLETSSRTIILFAFLAIPLAASFFLGANSPYPWARPLEQVARGEILEELRGKTRLLNPAFVAGRLVVYFAIWIVVSLLLNGFSGRWKGGSELAGRRLVNMSGPGLIAYAITVSLASMDWIMSLEPFWRSTIYPALYAIGQIMSGFAFATAAMVLLCSYPPLAGRVLPKHRRDLGGLLLAFVMLWAYFAFSQFLLIWVGNLPDESLYYFKRLRGGWQWIGLALLLMHFVLPFFVLIFRGAKENPKVLLGVAALVLGMRFVDVFWWIEPAFPHVGLPLFWLLDVAAFVAIGGVWSWWFLGRLKHVSLVPIYGANLCEAGGHHE